MTTSFPLPARSDWPKRAFSLPELSYPDQLNAAAELLDVHTETGLGDRPALYFEDRVLTFAQLRDQVDALGRGLLALGVEKGDRVLLRLNNSPELTVSWLASLKVGAVVVATLPLLRLRELEAVTEDCHPRVMITSPDLTGGLEPALSAFERVLISGDSLASLVRDHRGPLEPAPTRRSDVALIAYTSGSTGIPKGCAHFHEDVLAIADTYARHILKPTPEDVFSGHPTMAFTYGLGGLLIFPYRFGASAVLSGRFSPEEMLAVLDRYGATISFCGPTAYHLMLNASTEQRLDRLRLSASGGEPLAPVVFNAWKERFGVEIVEGIGATEMLHNFLSNRSGQARPGSCGGPVPGYEVRVVDADDNEVAPGVAGLLAVAGPTGCRYWNRPELQRTYVRAGWNYPGDIFVRDEDGYFWHQCRTDDLISSAGYKIAPPQVEKALLEHPAVAEAAVVGCPDSIRGQRVKAFLVLREPYHPTSSLSEEIQLFVKEKIAPYKSPKDVEFVDQLPRTGTGKVQRFKLRRS
jgi:2-aminobenzoate-CoA ligase